MAGDNKTKNTKQRIKSGTCPFKESNKESTKTDKPEHVLKHYGDNPEWRRHWSVVFRRMR